MRDEQLAVLMVAVIGIEQRDVPWIFEARSGLFERHAMLVAVDRGFDLAPDESHATRPAAPDEALRGASVIACESRTLFANRVRTRSYWCAEGEGLTRIRHGLQSSGGTLRLFDSFEPYDQTRLELAIDGPEGEALRKTAGKTRVKTPGKTPERIPTLLRNNPEAAIPDIALDVGRSASAVERAIRKMKSEGRLMRAGPDKGGQWVVLDSD